PPHVGLGTKTTLLLAIAAACNRDVGSPLGRRELQAVTRRGGTSGIGVNSFFYGGFGVDCGHPQRDAEYAPSAASVPAVAAPLAVQTDFPAEWVIHLALPSGRRLSGGDERNFFAANTPVPHSDVLQVLSAVYHGLVPA